MFGGSPLSITTAVLLFYYSFYIFSNNLLFTTSCSWNFRRRRLAMEALGSMVRYPGEPAANFVPPPPLKTKSEPAKREGKGTASGGDDTNQVAATSEIEEVADVESAEMRAMRRAAREGAMVIIDLKDAASCLCWSLVRRALRHVVRRPIDPCVPPQHTVITTH